MSECVATWRLCGAQVCCLADACWSAMQNLVDSLAQHFQEAVPSERHGELNTFVVYNQRSRVTSSAKRKRQPGSLKIHQTPDGSFFDLMRNARDMLLRCGFDVPQVSACISSVQLLRECCLSKSGQVIWAEPGPVCITSRNACVQAT
jgi:hypothetical protein